MAAVDLDIERLRRVLRERKRETFRTWASSNPYPAAVLMPLFKKEGECYLLFTERTDKVEHHKRQISFPGGARDPGDRSLQDTALRETEEEIGLASRDVMILGELDSLVTVSNFLVTPFVGVIPYPYPFRINEEEVAELIEVPLGHLLDKSHRRREVRPDGWVTYYYYYRDKVIWGATGWILTQFLNIISQNKLTMEGGKCSIVEGWVQR